MENPPIFHGTINYFDWAIFNSKLLIYQRVRDSHRPSASDSKGPGHNLELDLELIVVIKYVAPVQDT